MNRILAITKKNLLEIFHDYRSLIMIVCAPIVVLLMLKMAFMTNQNPNITVGTYHVQSGITREMNKNDKVKVHHYNSLAAAKKAMQNRKNSGIMYNQKQRLHIIYANTNTTKTAEMGSVIKFAMISAVKDKSLKMNQAMSKQLMQLKGMNMTKPTQAKAQAQHQKQQSKKALMPKVAYNYGNKNTNFFNTMMPIMISLFVFLFVFLVTGMALLQEKLKGTLSQILVTPTKRSQIVGGYAISYGILAVLQAIIVTSFAIWALRVQVVGSLFNIILISVMTSLVAVVIGLLISTLISSEYQMTQMMPVIVVPRLLFSGIIPIKTMGFIGQAIAHLMPVYYASKAIKKIILFGQPLSACLPQMLALLIFFILFFGLTTLSLKRFRRI